MPWKRNCELSVATDDATRQNAGIKIQKAVSQKVTALNILDEANYLLAKKSFTLSL